MATIAGGKIKGVSVGGGGMDIGLSGTYIHSPSHTGTQARHCTHVLKVKGGVVGVNQRRVGRCVCLQAAVCMQHGAAFVPQRQEKMAQRSQIRISEHQSRHASEQVNTIIASSPAKQAAPVACLPSSDDAKCDMHGECEMASSR